ncbi:hypothetical protein [Neobacillus sp. CF12]|uniref:hypothetical protein n=1 Tax=Neobacillus sp. CF12 TaxID=3055864 RepID=UPI0025A189A8|nr:hypothetical protein [Neobacillus sp. CF12]MDM5326212.1 hypothetical protein [Neobacillus sp. CF12]
MNDKKKRIRKIISGLFAGVVATIVPIVFLAYAMGEGEGKSILDFLSYLLPLIAISALSLITPVPYIIGGILILFSLYVEKIKWRIFLQALTLSVLPATASGLLSLLDGFSIKEALEDSSGFFLLLFVWGIIIGFIHLWFEKWFKKKRTNKTTYFLEKCEINIK